MIRTLEEVFDAIAKQEFVAKDLLVGAKDRLPGDETGSGTRCRFAFAGAGSRSRSCHSLSIGTALWKISRPGMLSPHSKIPSTNSVFCDLRSFRRGRRVGCFWRLRSWTFLFIIRGRGFANLDGSVLVVQHQ